MFYEDRVSRWGIRNDKNNLCYNHMCVRPWHAEGKKESDANERERESMHDVAGERKSKREGEGKERENIEIVGASH